MHKVGRRCITFNWEVFNEGYVFFLYFDRMKFLKRR